MAKESRGGKTKQIGNAGQKREEREQPKTLPREIHKARLAASPSIEGKKPYADTRRQAWHEISQKELDEANAIRTDNFIMPGNTFDGLKTGTRIEYTITVRSGLTPQAMRGTLEDIDGIRVGVARGTPGTPGYSVTDLYSGIAIGRGSTKAEAIASAKEALKRSGGKAAFEQMRVRAMENSNGTAARWIIPKAGD